MDVKSRLDASFITHRPAFFPKSSAAVCARKTTHQQNYAQGGGSDISPVAVVVAADFTAARPFETQLQMYPTVMTVNTLALVAPALIPEHYERTAAEP